MYRNIKAVQRNASLIFMSILSFKGLFEIKEGLDHQLATIKNDNLYNYFDNVKNYIELGP